MQTKNRAISLAEIRNILDQFLNQEYYNGVSSPTYIQDIMIGEGGQVFCFYETDGVYYQSDISISDGMIEISNLQEVFDRSSNQIRVIKQPNGKYRWFGITAVSVLNRIGVFDSKALFDNLTETLDVEPFPFATMVHVGENISLGSVDMVERYGHILLASGEFNDTDFATETRLLIEREPNYLGFSIGFWNNSETITKSKDNKLRAMYTKGKLKEISFLPEKYAAHPLTTILATNEKEYRMALPNEQALREMLSKMNFSEERIEDIVKGSNTVNRTIEDEKMEVRVKEEELEITQPETQASEKEQKEETRTEVKVEKEIAQSPSQNMEDFEIELSDELVRTIQSEIETNLNTKFAEMQERISALETINSELRSDITSLQNRIKGVEVEDQERIQEIVQDLPARAKSKIKVVTRARSLMDDEANKNPNGNILPDITKPEWAKNLSSATRQKSS